MKIVIDGLIGAGKSTQVGIISKLTGHKVVKEPIQEWPLDLFYSDPQRWGFMMQVAVLNSYVKLKFVDGIFERCPESTRAVFWQNLVNSKIVTQEENNIFQKLFSSMAWDPDVTIFIDKDPQLCFEHIQTRGQEGDTKITIEYLRNLHKLYMDYVKNEKNIHVINGNQPIEKVTDEILKILNPLINKTECPNIGSVLM